MVIQAPMARDRKAQEEEEETEVARTAELTYVVNKTVKTWIANNTSKKPSTI